MKPTITQIQAWFDEFNEKVFRNTLPSVPFKFKNTYKELGQFHWNGTKLGIDISTYYDADEDAFRNTLLHEMCHLYCHTRGWVKEGHGRRWKEVARYARSVTGLDITRCTDVSSWPIAEENKEHHERLLAKRNAPAILVDLDYGDHHFIVKTTKNVLISDKCSDWACRLRTTAKSYRIFISDNPRFAKYQSSRSLGRGYRYDGWEYERSIKPLLDKAVEVDELAHLFQGKYNFLGIN